MLFRTDYTSSLWGFRLKGRRPTRSFETFLNNYFLNFRPFSFLCMCLCFRYHICKIYHFYFYGDVSLSHITNTCPAPSHDSHSLLGVALGYHHFFHIQFFGDCLMKYLGNSGCPLQVSYFVKLKLGNSYIYKPGRRRVKHQLETEYRSHLKMICGSLP